MNELKPIKQYYLSDGILLERTAAKVTGTVVTRDGKVYCTEGDMRVTTTDSKTLTFRLNQNNITPGQQDTWEPPTMSTNNVPSGVSAEAIANEFIEFVEGQIKS